jgi:tRNA(Ile)-lysidine synthase
VAARRDPIDEVVRAALDELGVSAGAGAIGVACSGGADSMALAHAAIAARGAAKGVVVVHVDHGLRPDSADVARGVEAWAEGQGAGAVVRRVTVDAGASVEDAARRARYAALDRVIEERALVAMLTAHTARDQAETVLMRILRGTGPAGLAGIPRRRGRYLRPLLAVPRAATEAYVAAHGLPTWADPMNDDPRFVRARLRRLWPALAEENPAVDQALGRLAVAAGEWTQVIAEAVAAAGLDRELECARLAAAPPAIAKRAIAMAAERAGLALEAEHLDAAHALARRPTAGTIAIDVPGGRAVRVYDRLTIEAHAPTRAGLRSALARGERGTASARIDVVSAPGPTEIRPVRPGDRMRPARLRGKSRKLSDLYTDARVPRAARAAARVVVDAASGEILWAEHVGAAFGIAIEVAISEENPGSNPTRNPG